LFNDWQKVQIDNISQSPKLAKALQKQQTTIAERDNILEIEREL